MLKQALSPLPPPNEQAGVRSPPRFQRGVPEQRAHVTAARVQLIFSEGRKLQFEDANVSKVGQHCSW